jgi:hypothetical protein
MFCPGETSSRLFNKRDIGSVRRCGCLGGYIFPVAWTMSILYNESFGFLEPLIREWDPYITTYSRI